MFLTCDILFKNYLQPPWKKEMDAMFFTSPRSTVSHASFSPDAVNEHFNMSVLTSPSTARPGSKCFMLYLLPTVTGSSKARFSVTEDRTGGYRKFIPQLPCIKVLLRSVFRYLLTYQSLKPKRKLGLMCILLGYGSMKLTFLHLNPTFVSFDIFSFIFYYIL